MWNGIGTPPRSGFFMGQILIRNWDKRPVVYIKDLTDNYSGMIAVVDVYSLEAERGTPDKYSVTE